MKRHGNAGEWNQPKMGFDPMEVFDQLEGEAQDRRDFNEAVERAWAIFLEQRKRYPKAHDVAHVTTEPYVCIGLLAQWAAIGNWDDVAAMALAFSIAAETAGIKGWPSIND